MHIRKLALVAALLGVTVTHAQTDWTSLWNGKDLSGWTTWLARPEPTSNVPGLNKDSNGRYTEPIGSNRDPLNVFTVVNNVDGRPAIRVSGEVFGELRTKQSFKDYHLRFQFKWGEKKWPPRDAPATPRDSGLLYHVYAEPGAEGRTWARSVELQIQEKDVGDLYAVGSAIAVRVKTAPEHHAGRLGLRSDRRVDLLLAARRLTRPGRQAARRRAAHRRVEHGRDDCIPRRRHSHRQRPGRDASALADAHRHASANPGHIRADHPPVGRRRAVLPRRPIPADHGHSS